MNDLKSLIETLSTLSIKDLGKHLSNITNLYAKPFITWKKIISSRNESYELYILYIVYYSIVIFFLIDNSKYVIPITILELSLTIIPFSFLIIPFIFFRRVWKKRIKNNRLF